LLNKEKFMSGISIFIIILFILGNFPIVIGDNEEAKPFTDNNHVTPAIWGYSNILNKPGKALVLTLEQKQWQALVAVCTVPAFIGRSSATPLIFDDGSGGVTSIMPYDTKTIATWGSDAKVASAKLATEYWSKAELVFAVEKYEEALWIAPAASFLDAPILVTPTQDTLNSLSTKFVIAIGNTNVPTENIMKLTTKESVWTFQLELFETKGIVCNYVVLTNPLDTNDNTPENIKWKYQSPAAALLAAYRHGIVQTGDWSVDREAFEAVEKATEPDETNYNIIKPGFTKLKEESYAVEKFLQEHGHTPEFLAVVGGPFAVPNFVYDIHVDYYWPTKNPQKTQYPSSLAAYATLAQTVDEKKYTKEDLAAGRLAAGNIFDLTKQLMRTFFYREFLPDGDYYSQTPAGWENKACFADGHRTNQPEPDSLYWDRNEPYYPYEGVKPEFTNAGLTTNYYLPRNESDPYDTNMTIEKIMEATTNFGYFHFMPHGGLTNLRIEVGMKNESGVMKGQNVFLEASTINKLNYKAPTLIYTTSCKGAIWMYDNNPSTNEEFDPSDFTPSSFIHAGAVAYIATPEIQTACFWKEAPYSVSGDQAINFWKNVFSGTVPIGKAWRDAKWTAHSTWESKTPKPESPLTHHADCISYTLFGDPALEIYKPNVPFSTVKVTDVDVEIAEAISGEEFTVEVSVKDLETGTEISDANVKITFQGTEKTGKSATFTAPKDVGEHQVTVSISKSGYSQVTSKSWVQVEKGEEDGDGDGGFIPGFEAITVILIIGLVILIGIAFTRKYSK